MQLPKISYRAGILIILLLTVSAYAPCINRFALYDDGWVIADQRTGSLSNIPNLFFDQYWAGDKVTKLYRPLTLVLFALERNLFADQVAWLHLMTLLFHLATVVLTVLFIKKMTNSGVISLAAGTWFALHPIHTEVVSSLTGVSELGATLFVLAALSVNYNKHSRAWLAGLLLLVAMLFKESAAAGIILLFLMRAYQEWSVNKRVGWETIRFMIPSSLGVLLILLLRHWVLGSIAPANAGQMLWGMKLSDRISFIGLAFFKHFVLLIAPFHLRIDYQGYLMNMPFSIRWAKAIAAFAFIIGITWCALKTKNRTKAVSFGWLFLLFAYLPVSNLVPIGVVVAERLMYLPSIGASVLFGVIIEKVGNSKWKSAGAWLLVIGVMISFIAITYSRCMVWANPDQFWNRALLDSPNNHLILAHAGIHAMNFGSHEKAAPLLKKACIAQPGNEAVCFFAGKELYLLKRYQESLAVLARLTKRQTRETGAVYLVMARALEKMGNPEAAKEQALLALERNPALKGIINDWACELAEPAKSIIGCDLKTVKNN